MARTLLLNVVDDDEWRAALLEDGRLSLLWVERSEDRSLFGNVYKGRVVRVEPAIGAAFVDIGTERAGFLHASDVLQPDEEPDDDVEALGDEADDDEAEGEDAGTTPARDGRADAAIEDLLAEGQEVLVQVTRDAIRNKGPSLTTRISLAGRLLVLVVGSPRRGISRRIEDEERRAQLRAMFDELETPEDCGLVARTAAAAAGDDALRSEFARLCAAHAGLRAAADTARGPGLLRAADDFVTRAVQELLVRSPEGSDGPVTVVADTPAAAEAARRCLGANISDVTVEEHASAAPLFHVRGVEAEVRRLGGTRVPLPGGASIVIEETEALWAIDVNSGRRRHGANLEETALQTDLLAAREIARQIRLRDLGGLLVVDFIDCREPENRRQVEEAFRVELARDPARMRVAPVSEFMVVEITRKRARLGPGRSGSERCPSCGGRGRLRSAAAASVAALRDTRALLAAAGGGSVEIVCADGVALELERRADALAAMEERFGAEIRVRTAASMGSDGFTVRRVD